MLISATILYAFAVIAVCLGLAYESEGHYDSIRRTAVILSMEIVAATLIACGSFLLYKYLTSHPGNNS